ncbi:MAG: hypothetical protein HYY35_08850, partial [Deltaproteobacteria bacterium]|nr:hypothetical protein [Deltaproteobacteria bacterium]
MGGIRSIGRVPVHCIIPPHMLKEIARRGTASQQDWAWRTLGASEQIRGQRQALTLIAGMGAA